MTQHEHVLTLPSFHWPELCACAGTPSTPLEGGSSLDCPIQEPFPAAMIVRGERSRGVGLSSFSFHVFEGLPVFFAQTACGVSEKRRFPL